MTVYNFNRGIGWASSGVEYAQIYRARVLRRLGIRARFVFTDMIHYENIEHLTKNIGFEDEEVIWLYSFFTDFHIAPTSYTAEQLEKTFEGRTFTKSRLEKKLHYAFSEEDSYVDAIFAKDSDKYIWQTEIVSKGKLVRRDYFSYGRVFSEFYVPAKEAEACMRRYYNQDGSTAYTEILGAENSLFSFPDRKLYSKEELIVYLMERLHLKKEDVVILDRAQEIGQAVFRNHRPARFGIVIHAEHYNPSSEKEENILWNNHYEYTFRHADQIDFIIASTREQAVILRKQLFETYGFKPFIVTIPVGSIDALSCRDFKNGRTPRSFITASRLASEKHIDWLIDAFVKIHAVYEDAILDIYGGGAQEKELKKRIEDSHADSYIRLMGHQDLKNIYGKYTCYVSASTSEGFGLTLMEAVGSGLIMVGFDVHYGNQTFIRDGQNGFLVPHPEDADPEQLIEGLRDKIQKICAFDEAQKESFSEASYDIAEDFLTRCTEEKWKELLLPDSAADGFTAGKEEM